MAVGGALMEGFVLGCFLGFGAAGAGIAITFFGLLLFELVWGSYGVL